MVCAGAGVGGPRLRQSQERPVPECPGRAHRHLQEGIGHRPVHHRVFNYHGVPTCEHGKLMQYVRVAASNNAGTSGWVTSKYSVETAEP